MSFTSFENAENIVNRFISLLHNYGISPAIGTQIENEFLSPLELLESTRNLGGLVNDPKLMAEAGGMYDLAAKLLAVENQLEFQSFIPHLKLFGSENEFSTVVQSNKGDIRDDINRKLAELYLGSLAIHFSFNVQLDHPVNSKGDNPDVMFEIRPKEESSSSIWTLAIKTVSSRSGQTIFENIKKAAEQIDAPQCQANRGIVVINLKNSLDYDQLWATTYISLEDAKVALDNQMANLIAAANTQRSSSDWELLFANRTSPIVFYFAHAVVKICLPNGQEVPTILKISKLANPLDLKDDIAVSIVYNLNEGMQNILLGIPGDFERAPA